MEFQNPSTYLNCIFLPLVCFESHMNCSCVSQELYFRVNYVVDNIQNSLDFGNWVVVETPEYSEAADISTHTATMFRSKNREGTMYLFGCHAKESGKFDSNLQPE